MSMCMHMHIPWACERTLSTFSQALFLNLWASFPWQNMIKWFTMLMSIEKRNEPLSREYITKDLELQEYEAQ